MSRPYPEYRDSGDEWLGALPSHWAARRLKQVADASPSNVDKKSHEGELPVRLCNYTDVYYNDVIADADGLMAATASADQVEKFSLRAGDVIITKDSETADDIAVSAYVPDDLPGVVCGYHLSMIRPRSGTSGAFLKRYFDSHFAKASVAVRANGLTRVGLGQYAVDNLLVPAPPLEEQTTIAAFLDRETGKIDALVEAQRRLIDLLKQKRQAAISHAVTKGLDPVARLKDSGVEWLGEVPAHWAVMPIRKVARLESGHTPSRQKAEYWVEEECVIPWFTLADVGVLRSGKVTHVSDTTHRISELGMANSAARLLPQDTVFLSRTASVGFSGIMTQPMAVSQDFAAWVCGPELSSEYLLLCLRAMRPEFRRLMMGSTHQTIYMPDIEKLSIPLPPKSEQEAIVRFAFSQKALLDNLEDEAEKAIRLLRERRAGLISAAVIGKIDVRQPTTTTATTATADQATARRLVGAAVLELVADNATSGRMTSAKRMYLAEAHAGVWELRGQPERKAAGPFDSALMGEVETELARVGHIATSQPGGSGSQVHYSLTGTQGALRAELDAMLGDRRAVFDKMLADLGTLESKGVEAIATLYAVWNDMLIDGQTPTDDAVINGVLNDWHTEKRDKFTRPDLVNYLGWMRRHDLTPSGRRPRTKSGALL